MLRSEKRIFRTESFSGLPSHSSRKGCGGKTNKQQQRPLTSRSRAWGKHWRGVIGPVAEGGDELAQREVRLVPPGACIAEIRKVFENV